MVAEPKFLLDSVGRNAGNDVVRVEQNFHKVQVSLLKTSAVPKFQPVTDP